MASVSTEIPEVGCQATPVRYLPRGSYRTVASMVTICRCGCPRPPPPLSRKKKKHRPPCDDGSLPPRRAARDWIFLPPADDAVDVGVTSVEMASAMVRLAQIMINENGLSSRARDGETTSLISKRRVPILPARWWWGGGEENAAAADIVNKEGGGGGGRLRPPTAAIPDVGR